jgi:hypothetical protein
MSTKGASSKTIPNLDLDFRRIDRRLHNPDMALRTNPL